MPISIDELILWSAAFALFALIVRDPNIVRRYFSRKSAMKDPLFHVNQTLALTVRTNPQDAIDGGDIYPENEFTKLKIAKGVVVMGGTQQGNPTVDLVLIDEAGKKYITFISTNLLKMLP